MVISQSVAVVAIAVPLKQAQERGHVFPPSHLVPQCSLLEQVDHKAMSGSQLALEKHFIHDIIIDFPPFVLSPSPFPVSLLL